MKTDPHSVVGTAGYMAPEQLRGEPVDATTDIFSLGALLYEMVTGRPAFIRATVIDSLSAILAENPDVFAVSERLIPYELARVIQRCLEKKRDGAVPVRARSRVRAARDRHVDGALLSSRRRRGKRTRGSGRASRSRWSCIALVRLRVFKSSSLRDLTTRRLGDSATSSTPLHRHPPLRQRHRRPRGGVPLRRHHRDADQHARAGAGAAGDVAHLGLSLQGQARESGERGTRAARERGGRRAHRDGRRAAGRVARSWSTRATTR